MKPNKLYKRSFILTMALAAVFALAAAWPCAAAAPNPTPIDLGLLPAGTVSDAYAINNAGQVVGSSYDADGSPLPFIWQNGVMTQLPLPGPGEAFGINASGQIVGEYIDATGAQACLWEPTRKGWALTLLGMPEGYTGSYAISINDAGQVLAEVEDDTGNVFGCVWQSGAWTLLKDSSGMPLRLWGLQAQEKINQKGQVLAMTPIPNLSGYSDLLLWDNGTATPVVQNIETAHMNNSGQVVGVYYDGTGDRNFTYDSSSQALTLGGSGSYLENINDSGEVLVSRPQADGSTLLGIFTFDGQLLAPLGIVSGQVGYVTRNSLNLNANGEVSGLWTIDFSPQGAFYASATAGVVLLNGLVQSPSYLVVTAMNDSGMIIGGSSSTGSWDAILWAASPTVGTATVSRKGKTITVTVPITNTNTGLTATNVTITSASLDSGTLTSALPLAVKSIAPGATVSVTIKFSTSGMLTGPQALMVGGTSSLGDFSRTQTVTVP